MSAPDSKADGSADTHDGLTQIYARIKRTSRYRHQQVSQEPFAVDFDSASDSHLHPYGFIARGNNGNHYRLRDLRLFIKQGDEFVAIN